VEQTVEVVAAIRVVTTTILVPRGLLNSVVNGLNQVV